MHNVNANYCAWMQCTEKSRNAVTRTGKYDERVSELLTTQSAKSASSTAGSAGQQASVALKLVGIDEVGRGAWAGPVVAAAVILSQPIVGLADSKLLNKKTREELAKTIYQEALAVGVGWIGAKQVDELGLTSAIRLAMQEAIDQIKIAYDQIIIDGAFNFLPSNKKALTQIKADQTVPVVSAASIIAKVARDDYMAAQALKYPQYYFERHVGYGTKLHQTALQKYGLCDLHRQSYKPVQRFMP